MEIYFEILYRNLMIIIILKNDLKLIICDSVETENISQLFFNAHY